HSARENHAGERLCAGPSRVPRDVEALATALPALGLGGTCFDGCSRIVCALSGSGKPGLLLRPLAPVASRLRGTLAQAGRCRSPRVVDLGRGCGRGQFEARERKKGKGKRDVTDIDRL